MIKVQKSGSSKLINYLTNKNNNTRNFDHIIILYLTITTVDTIVP